MVWHVFFIPVQRQEKTRGLRSRTRTRAIRRNRCRGKNPWRRNREARAVRLERDSRESEHRGKKGGEEGETEKEKRKVAVEKEEKIRDREMKETERGR